MLCSLMAFQFGNNLEILNINWKLSGTTLTFSFVKKSTMKIQEMFDALGLTVETVNQLIADVNLYNFQHPDKPMSVIYLDADINSVTMTQMPMIGRAIAKERGREFLDDEKKQPLHFDTNAMRYGSLEIAKYYDAEHLFQ